MILVKIELHSARTGKVTELGRMQICNDGTSDSPKRGDYEVSLFRKGSTTKVQRKGLVHDYPRLSYTIWELVRRALECTLGKWPIHPGRPEEFDEEIVAFYQGSEHESAVAKSDRNGLDWLNRFRAYVYQNNRDVALEAEEQLLVEDNGPTTDQVSFGAAKPDAQGFTKGSKIEPGYISEEFKAKCRALGLDMK